MERLTFAFWRSHGLSVRASNVLCQLNCASFADVHRFGSAEVLKTFSLGPKGYNEIARLMGWEEIKCGTHRSKNRDRAPPVVPSVCDDDDGLDEVVELVMAQIGV